MKIFLDRVIILFFVVFFSNTVCMNGDFRGLGEMQVHAILENSGNYQELHHNRWYLNGQLQQNIYQVQGGCEADIEFIKNGRLFVIEVKSTLVGLAALGATIGRYLFEQMQHQVLAYPAHTTIKIVLDVRGIPTTQEQRIILKNVIVAGGVIANNNVGFLIDHEHLIGSDNAEWMP